MTPRLLWLLFILGFSFGCAPSAPPGPIVLGHLESGQSDDEMHGIALAVETINADAANSILRRKLKVVHADAGVTPDETQGQAIRLLSIDKVEGLIGPNRWLQAEKIAPAAQSPGTIAMLLNGYAGSPASASLFPVGIAPAERGRALARYVKERVEGANVVVLIEAEAPIPRLVAKAFVKHFGGVDERTIKAGEAPDSQKNLGKPSAILMCGSTKSVLAWRSKLPTGTLLFGGEEVDMQTLQAESDPMKPIVAAVSFHAADKTPAAQEFVRQFQEKHGKPPTIDAALAHDAVAVWAQAVRRANSLHAESIRDQLLHENATFEVLTGQLSYAANHSPRRPIFLVKIDGNQTSKLFRYEP
jgi:ABC-type branched-subunit amino acid transport system substrate-binding protein